MFSLAFRNLGRNLRRTLITAGAFTQRSRAFLSLWKGEVLEKPIAVSTLREKVKKVLQAQDMAVA